MSLLSSPGAAPPPGPGRRLALGAAVAILIATAVGLIWLRARPSAPVATPPPPSPRPSATAAPATGGIEVVANLPDAVVAIDGRRLGVAPRRAEDLTGGAHTVRVEKPGYPAFDQEVHVIPGRLTRIEARLSEAPPRLEVTSDVVGASVFLDHTFLGKTPLVTSEVRPGPHHLSVAAEGLDIQDRQVEIHPGSNRVEILLREKPPLEASVAVIHRHAFGSCKGRLHAHGDRIAYETDGKDAFDVPLASVTPLEVDYLKKSLHLEIRGGRSYNFTGNPDALLTFSQAVQAAR